MAVDDFVGSNSQDFPASSAVAVTTSDTVDLTHVPRGLYVGVGGDVKVNMLVSGTAVTFVGVPTGTLLPIRVTRVYAAGTTSDSIVAVW